eukprot:scaffold23499_cov109-Cylindrotheca_fusiformis.AAC.12
MKAGGVRGLVEATGCPGLIDLQNHRPSLRSLSARSLCVEGLCKLLHQAFISFFQKSIALTNTNVHVRSAPAIPSTDVFVIWRDFLSCCHRVRHR